MREAALIKAGRPTTWPTGLPPSLPSPLLGVVAVLFLLFLRIACVRPATCCSSRKHLPLQSYPSAPLVVTTWGFSRNHLRL